MILSFPGLLSAPDKGGYITEDIIAVPPDKNSIEWYESIPDPVKSLQPAEKHLIRALADEDRWIRYLAAEALADIGATQAVDPLISLLSDPDRNVRFAAAAALGKLGNPKAIPHLQDLLGTDDGYVKIAVQEALEVFGPQVRTHSHTQSP